MTSQPTPDDTVPDFLVENFETEPASKLRAISVFVENDERRSAVPQYVRNAFAVQDDSVKRAVGEYAGDLAAYLESGGYETLAEAPEPEQESGPPGETMGGAFYNPGRNPTDDDDDDDGLLGGLLGD